MSFRLGDAEWVAWYAPAPSEQPRSQMMNEDQKSSSAYYEAMEAEAKAVAAETTLRAANIRFFLGVGEQQQLFWAIPGLPALDVIEFAQVGTHNGAPGEWRVVRDFVSTSLAGIAFDVVFADAAGLDLRFITPVSTDVARRVDKALLDRMGRRTTDCTSPICTCMTVPPDSTCPLMQVPTRVAEATSPRS